MTEIEDIYPLTPMQAGLLYHSVGDNWPGVYVVQMRFELTGALDAAALLAAWQAVAARHAVLRTAVVWDEVSRPVQAVMSEVEVPLVRYDLRGADPAEQADRIAELLRDDRLRGFDLAEAPLMRVLLIRLEHHRHLMVWSHHHVVLDGWSTALLTDELFDRYARIVARDQEPRYPPVPSFREYVAWLARRTETADGAFWAGELDNYRMPVRLDLDRPDPASGSAPAPDWCDRELGIAAGRLAGWRAAARRAEVTFPTLVQAAWAVLLARHDPRAPGEVVFGMVTAVRDHERAGGDQVIGLCVNTLPARVSLAGSQPRGSWLHGIHQAQARAAQHDAVDVGRFRAWTQLPPGEPLFRYILAVENYPQGTLAAGVLAAGVDVRYLGVHEATNYALTAGVPVGAQPRLKLTADASRVPRADLDRLLGQWAAILDRLASGDAATVGELLTGGARPAAPRRELARPAPVSGAPPGDTVLDRFAIQAMRRPGAPAVTCGDTALTYAELDYRAGSLARHLVILGAVPGERVGLVADRSVDLIVAIIGILRAGCAYVPIDPAYPAARRRFIAADAGVRLMVVDRPDQPVDAVAPERGGAEHHRREHGEDGGMRVVVVGDDHARAGQGVRLPRVGARELAYIIYTSGSTGTPKGVLITHDNIAAMLDGTWRHGRFDDHDVWTLCHSYAFDFSVFEMWGALAYGGRLVVVPAQTAQSPDALHGLVRSQRITVFCQTPSAFGGFITADGRSASGVGPALRLILFGGEDLGTVSLGDWARRYGDQRPRLVNLYGITETTVHTTWHEVAGDLRSSGETTSRIGTELDGWSVRLLDEAMNPVPDGVIGEIFVGGAGLARGYVGRPGLTAQRFVPDPITPGARLYRSGDRARRLADGTLEYVGRADAQVKIRGVRIEPGEVESVLVEHPAVEQCVVAARRFGPQDVRLVAFVRPAGAAEPGEEDLLAFARARLPMAMVPSRFVRVSGFPLTPSGKIDRTALRDVEVPSNARAGGTPPRTPTERVVAAAWCSVLDAERVGVDENFFDVGGHSLLMFALLQMLRAAGWSWLSMVDLFANSTVAAQALLLDAAGGAGPAGSVDVRVDEERGRARGTALLNLRARREGRQ